MICAMLTPNVLTTIVCAKKIMLEMALFVQVSCNLTYDCERMINTETTKLF